MHKHDFNIFLELTQKEILETSRAGQKEYALGADAFDNFNRLATTLQLDRKKVLWTYLQKHLDGITSYLNGHQSQREDVTGRIKDAIVYLFLLWAMIEEERRAVNEAQVSPIKADEPFDPMRIPNAINELDQRIDNLRKEMGTQKAAFNEFAKEAQDSPVRGFVNPNSCRHSHHHKIEGKVYCADCGILLRIV